MSLPGGWELILIIVIIVIFFGGPGAINTLKKAGKDIYSAKKEVDSIKKITKE